jgi:Putative peptidoglycan binding domain
MRFFFWLFSTCVGLLISAAQAEHRARDIAAVLHASSSAARSDARPFRVAEANTRKRGSASPASDASQPPAEAVAVQFDLAWTGDYSTLITGEDGEKTVAAIKSFQKNHRFKETGVLNVQEKAVLAAAAKAKQVQVGWTIVDDAATGARLGIPARQVSIKSQGKSGTRWSSAQGQVQIETFKVREPGTTLAAIYEQQRKEPATRRIEINVLRPNFFFLSGMQGLKHFYVRGDFKDGEVRGLSILYDQATENIMDPAAVASASAFSAFPGSGLLAQIGRSPRPRVEYGTGIVVSASGHVLTERQLTDGCNVIVVSGHGDADRLTEDGAAELALLRVYGVTALVPAAFAAAVANDVELTLLGVADPHSQEGGAAISSAPAKLKGDLLEATPPLGFAGAAAVDAQGRIVGMVELKKPVLASSGNSAAQQAAFIPAAAIRSFLAAQRIPANQALAGTSAQDSVVRVICVRK